MDGQPALLGYESASPNEYKWTLAAYEALSSGAMLVEIAGSDGIRRATISGSCPRCGHEVHFDQILDAVVGEDGGLRTLGLTTATSSEPMYLELVVSCRCTEAHAGRPDGVTSGCGINFRVDVLDPR